MNALRPESGKIELLKQKRACFEKFWELTQAQCAALERGDEEDLLRQIEARVPLMEEADKLEIGLKAQVTEDDGEASELESEIHQLLVRIRDKDAENLQSIKSSMEEYTGKAKELGQKRKGLKLYNEAFSSPYSGYFDKKQ